MAKKAPEKITVFPNEIDWNKFDTDELEQIDLAVSLMESYVAGRKSRPEPLYVKNMFLDEFDGFEDTTPEMAVAITEKLCEIWDAEHTDAEPKKTPTEQFIESEMIYFEGCDDDLKAEAKEAIKGVAPYVGKRADGKWILTDFEDEDALKAKIPYDKAHSKRGVDNYIAAAEYAEGIEDKLNVILRKFVRTFEGEIYRRPVVDDYVDAIRNEEGLGTPVYPALNAIRKILTDADTSHFAAQCTPMDFIAGAPIGAVITVSWLEDDELKMKTVYGHGVVKEEEDEEE